MTGAWALTVLLGLFTTATDLADAGRADRLPILLYVSRSDCTFCRRLEVDVLHPLLRSGTLQGRILVRELVLDNPENITDFDGQLIAPRQLAARYAAELTPTLLFLDSRGEPLHRPIRGYSGSEYFSYYLEQAINESVAALSAGGKQPPCRQSTVEPEP